MTRIRPAPALSVFGSAALGLAVVLGGPMASASGEPDVSIYCSATGQGAFACTGWVWPEPVWEPAVYAWSALANAALDEPAAGTRYVTGSCSPGLPTTVDLLAGPIATPGYDTVTFTC
ncbi:MAG TPA: hypothetical protein VGD67_15235 [Pseudonocardiaceae bacterium]